MGSLIGLHSGEGKVQSFLRTLPERPEVKPDWAIQKVRYIFAQSGVILIEHMMTSEVKSILLHGPGALFAEGYQGALPCGLRFVETRPAVLARMPPPSYSGFLGSGRFDAWARSGHMLRVGYTEDEVRTVSFHPWHPVSS